MAGPEPSGRCVDLRRIWAWQWRVGRAAWADDPHAMPMVQSAIHTLQPNLWCPGGTGHARWHTRGSGSPSAATLQKSSAVPLRGRTDRPICGKSVCPTPSGRVFR